ncbi:hypothetical protein NIE88_12450 [Sporolactobacillus shoreicorticis]|uniref:Uncharacterized protein n=1 Tax=Sporolactobacillus shoreicorticis TaxID=1923877 RepID=A0ABW5S9J2_9BACL|nr:hypothetical protein [Sporolactobacillus shoreicorticis]MCO7126575.1 hypothetical protein [Sporolactobacillus shoreicorticis]
MKTFFYSVAFLVIGGLGLFGLLSMFLPSQKSVIIAQLIIIALIVIVGLFFFRRLAEWTGNGDQARYNRALRQSRKRKKMTSIGRKVRTIHPAAKFKVIKSESSSLKTFTHQSTKDHGHLTVIEGRKNKKKKRLLF